MCKRRITAQRLVHTLYWRLFYNNNITVYNITYYYCLGIETRLIVANRFSENKQCDSLILLLLLLWYTIGSGSSDYYNNNVQTIRSDRFHRVRRTLVLPDDLSRTQRYRWNVLAGNPFGNVNFTNCCSTSFLATCHFIYVIFFHPIAHAWREDAADVYI